MGFFSDKCRALVDDRGFALTGDALREARRDKKAKRCGARVKKAARACSQCGAPAPGGWARCGNCGKWVGNESDFCWNCGHELHADDRTALADGRWRKPAGALAQRLEVGDLKAQLNEKKAIVVDEGSRALLLQNGAYRDTLEAGAHTLESLGRKINHWGDPPPRSVVMVDGGDIGLVADVEGLESAEKIPLALSAGIVVRLATTDKLGQAFMANVMKDRRELSVEDTIQLFKEGIRASAKELAFGNTVQELFENPELHLQLEEVLERRLKADCEHFGFELIRVNRVDFTGSEYEKLRAAEGESELRRLGIEYDKKMRAMENEESMARFRDRQDLSEYMEQLAQEAGIAAEQRKQEMAVVLEKNRHALDLMTRRNAQEAERVKTGFEQAQRLEAVKAYIDEDALKRDHDRGQKLKDARAESEAGTIEHEDKVKRTQDWLQVRAERDRQKLAVEKEHLDNVEGRGIQTLIAGLPPDQAEHLLKLQALQNEQGRSPEELLALAARDNPDLVRILGQMQETKLARDRESADRQRDDMRDLMDRFERTLTKAMETTSDAAKNPGAGGTVTHINK